MSLGAPQPLLLKITVKNGAFISPRHPEDGGGGRRRYMSRRLSARRFSLSGHASFMPTAAPPCQPRELPPLQKTVPGLVRVSSRSHRRLVRDSFVQNDSVVRDNLADALRHKGGRHAGTARGLAPPFLPHLPVQCGNLCAPATDHVPVKKLGAFRRAFRAAAGEPFRRRLS